jgi:hypothetical protein
MRSITSSVVLAALLLASGPVAFGGISKIFAHGDEFSASDTIPVFVDTVRNSIRVKGQFMDLCTDVDSNDPSFVVNIGDRVRGPNSSVEILVAAKDAPDLDDATITIKFLSGQETFKIKAYKTAFQKMEVLEKGSSPTCRVGETIILSIEGVGLDHVYLSATARMMEIADRAEGGPHYDPGTWTAGATRATLRIACKAVGAFSIVREWFWDERLRQYVGAPTKMIRGSAPTKIRVTVVAP